MRVSHLDHMSNQNVVAQEENTHVQAFKMVTRQALKRTIFSVVGAYYATKHCNAEQGRTRGMQGNIVLEEGLFCNYYRISPVTGKNGNDCRITLLSSQDFSVRPLFYFVQRFSVCTYLLGRLLNSSTNMRKLEVCYHQTFFLSL